MNNELNELKDIYFDLVKRKDELELELKTVNAKITTLVQESIPSLMSEMQESKATMEDGTEIKTKWEVYATFPKKEERIGPAVKWLREHELEDIIKTNLINQFGIGEIKKAESISNFLALNYQVESTIITSVHPQTLRSALRKAYENGIRFEESLFGAIPVKVATLKR